MTIPPVADQATAGRLGIGAGWELVALFRRLAVFGGFPDLEAESQIGQQDAAARVTMGQ